MDPRFFLDHLNDGYACASRAVGNSTMLQLATKRSSHFHIRYLEPRCMRPKDIPEDKLKTIYFDFNVRRWINLLTTREGFHSVGLVCCRSSCWLCSAEQRGWGGNYAIPPLMHTAQCWQHASAGILLLDPPGNHLSNTLGDKVMGVQVPTKTAIKIKIAVPRSRTPEPKLGGNHRC
jgi:hypothetical protein